MEISINLQEVIEDLSMRLAAATKENAFLRASIKGLTDEVERLSKDITRPEQAKSDT